MRQKQNKVLPEDTQEASTKWFSTRSGTRLRIRIAKPTDTHPNKIHPQRMIFFIHGVGGSSDIWSSQIQFFANKGYFVIAPDLIGHGFSSAPDDPSNYKFRHICHDLIDIFDEHYKDVNYIVGHSYGTSFATYLAHFRSSRIQKLVLMSGGAPVALAPQPGVLSLPSFVLSCLRPALTRFFLKSAFHRKSKKLQNKQAAFDVPLYVLRHTMSGQIWDEGDEAFHKLLSQPTLLLHGDSDKLEATENTGFMHEVLQESEFHVIPNSGHMIMMEQPVLINYFILKFLEHENLVRPNENVSPLSTPITTPRHSKIKLKDQHSITKSQPNLSST